MGSRLLARLRRVDGFFLAMLAVISLAASLPELGRTGGWLHLEHLGNLGVAIVFFLHGLNLAPESLRAGVLRWRLHLAVQAMTFLVFPVLYLLLKPLLKPWLPPGLLLGFCYLCVLPSTITSSVAMTAYARGNVPAAIFNASLSSLLGILLTPAWVSLLAHSHGHPLPLLPTVENLALMLLAPMLLGQLLRPLLGRWAARQKPWLGKADKAVILMLVLSAFSDSVAGGVWSGNGFGTLALTLVVVVAILTCVLVLSTFLARCIGFSREDEMVLVFCGSKKTLAAGVPMAKLLFGALPSLGLILLPIMLYHQCQLLVCARLAARYARASGAGE